MPDGLLRKKITFDFLMLIYIITIVMKKIILFITAFLFLSSEVDLIKINFLNFSQNLTSVELLILTFILFFCFYLIINFKKFNLKDFFSIYKNFLIISLIFILIGFVSSILSPVEKIYPFKYLIRYFLFILTAWLLTFIIYSNKQLKNYFLLSIFYFGLLLSIIAFFEVINNDFATFLANIFRDGKSVYINNKLRPAATLTHSNIFACFLGISIICGLKLLFENVINKRVFYIILSFILIAFSLSSSRNAIFSFLLTLFLLLLNKKYVKTILVIAFIFILSYFIFSPSKSRISEVKTQSSISRILLSKTSLNIFLHYPWFGVGPGCFNRLLIKYAPQELLETEEQNIKNSALNAHNGFFNVLAEFGIFGISVILLFFILYLIIFIKNNRLFPISFNFSLLSIISLPFVADAFFYSYFYMIIFLTLLFLLLQKDF